MFWNFMNKVHALPLYEERDVKPWWTEEEKKKVKLIEHQLSYVRRTYKDQNIVLPVMDEGECFGPDVVCQGGKIVWGLKNNWVKFFEQHLGLGKYLGTVWLGENDLGWVEGPKRGKWDGEVVLKYLEDDSMQCDIYVGGECVGRVQTYDEPDDECVFVFEKGSIAYAHYGRGAGISVRMHNSLGIEGDVLEHFQKLKG